MYQSQGSTTQSFDPPAAGGRLTMTHRGGFLQNKYEVNLSIRCCQPIDGKDVSRETLRFDRLTVPAIRHSLREMGEKIKGLIVEQLCNS